MRMVGHPGRLSLHGRRRGGVDADVRVELIDGGAHAGGVGLVPDLVVLHHAREFAVEVGDVGSGDLRPLIYVGGGCKRVVGAFSSSWLQPRWGLIQLQNRVLAGALDGLRCMGSILVQSGVGVA